MKIYVYKQLKILRISILSQQWLGDVSIHVKLYHKWHNGQAGATTLSVEPGAGSLGPRSAVNAL